MAHIYDVIAYVLPGDDPLLVCLFEGIGLDGHFEGSGLSEFNQGDVANALRQRTSYHHLSLLDPILFGQVAQAFHPEHR